MSPTIVPQITYLCILYLCTHACACVYGRGHACVAQAWRSEGNLLELILSFHYMGHKDQTQVVKLSGRHFYSRSSKKLLSYSQYAYVCIYVYVNVYIVVCMCACIIRKIFFSPSPRAVGVTY